jgi:catechol 2,3-dioxygenase-like lactoylglutathione lyase family enzyme
MPVQLDHLILMVNDRQRSLDFYTEVLGFAHEGERPPFSLVRVNDGLLLQIAPWGTGGGLHLAFAMSRAEFERIFQRVRERGLEYGDAFDTVGSQRGPGDEAGARGPGKAVYVFDPDRHLIEIRHYD